MKLTPFATAMLACYSRAASQPVVHHQTVGQYQDDHLDHTCEKELIWVGKKSMTLADLQSERESG